MKFSEVLAQASALLQHRGRLSYRTLRMEFDLNDEQLDVLKEQLVDIEALAADKDGKMLVWKGDSGAGTALSEARGSSTPATTQAPPPATYTPPHLAERIRAEQAALEARASTDGERKTITALFADLKGSTALIEGLDPEEARTIIDPALRVMMEAVHLYEGYVAQALGDGILALFGAPLAHEDHPQRAVYAALRMQEEMRRYSDQIRLTHGVPLAMRVGVNTGEVVVRSIRKDDLHTDYVPVGHSTNLAARMEQMATPGSILITEDTKRLIEGYFELKGLGAAEIKGRAEPLPVYEVVGVGPLRTKLQVAARRGLTRFVGRQSELEQLRQALVHANAGHGQIVGVMGEPGLGKSRLFYEFKLLSLGGCLVLDAYSVSHGKAAAYLPVIELLKSYFDIQAQDEERKRREKVTGKVLTLDRSLEDLLPHLFTLLGIADAAASLQQMDPQIRRQRTFEALKKLFLRESLNQPLVLIFEDLHWIDSETQGFLDLLCESVASAKLLLLTNYRPEYHHQWGSKTYYTQLRLAPLGKAEVEDLLTVLLGADASLAPVKALIVEKTEGTPFFMEEMTQALAEEGVLLGERGAYRLARAPTTLHLPPTVHALLAARIDRLAPEEKALLQQLAVIGRQFPASVVRQVIPQPEADLYRLLAVLQRKEFLYEQPAFPEVEYLFKHALTQEVAYSTVLQEHRKALHERTGRALEVLYAATLHEHYSDLAHHYSRSGNTQKAIGYLRLAGQQAIQRSANAEAITHLAAALELLKTLPDTLQRAQQELSLQIALGVPLMASKGFAAPEVERAYDRARALCAHLGETPQLFPVLWGLRQFYHVRGVYPVGRQLGEQMLALARAAQDSELLLEAHYGQGSLLSIMGELTLAQEHLEHGLLLYDPQKHRAHALLYGGQDPGVGCLSVAAVNLWFLGYPDRALKRMHEALTLAREVSNPLSVAFALSFAAVLHQCRREGHFTAERAAEVRTLANEQGFALFGAWGMYMQGWALAEQGHGEEGTAQIQQGIATYRATGAELARPYQLMLLADAYQRGKQPEAGLRVLSEALAVSDRTGEHIWAAELYRLKGELTLQQASNEHGAESAEQESATPHPQGHILKPDAHGEAEAYFLNALTIARQQQAKSPELRAATSLARLWQQQGKEAEAYRLLSEIYTWFTEGFDAKDLQEAKALLAELH